MSDGISINNQPSPQPAHNDRLERTVQDMRVEVAAGLAGINARLDAQQDHGPRLRAVETQLATQLKREDVAGMLKDALANQLTREDVAGMLESAIEASRRPAWRDVGMLITAILASTGLVTVAIRALS